MPPRSPRDESILSLASEPATMRHRRVAFVFTLGIVAAFVAVAAVGLVPLPRSDGFIPAVQAIITAVELITAVLLFAQCVTERSRALLVLAGGYLFTALIVVAHTLTFPGAFTATGLFGASAQTAAWLYVVWHVAIPTAALCYALLKARPPGIGQTTPGVWIQRTVAGLLAAAVAVTWALIEFADNLPTLVVSETGFAGTASAVTALAMVLSALALGFLWRRRQSVLDEWLLVALVASLAETGLVVFLGASRYTFPFYASRLLAVMAASAVLVALLSEMTQLYLRLTTAVRALQRERANKLMNLDVVVGSVAHEIKQPLMVITTCNTVIENLLRKPRVDVEEVRLNLRDVTSASVRIAETIDGLRGLFRDPQEAHQRLDLNALALESLRTMEAEIAIQQIAVTTELAPNLPAVVGHRGQLREVFINIVQNAIDALGPLSDRARTLRLRTSYAPQRSRLLISIEDSGVGIESDRLPGLFTAFVTTKERGMGLGLSLCQMIVDRHNGELSVSSEIGKGTRFEISLPVEPPAAPAESSGIPAGSVNAET